MKNISCLPVEIWDKVASFLESSRDLRNLTFCCKDTFQGTIQYLYRNPRFNPLATRQIWIDFIDRILSRSGIIDYSDYLSNLDDVWCFVGSESETEVPDSNGLLPYSFLSFAWVLLERKMLKSLKISFYTADLKSFFEFSALTSLKELVLSIRVSDEIIQSIFSENQYQMERLVISRAEITDSSLFLMASSCLEMLKEIDLSVIPVENRSRYERLINPKANQSISDKSICHLFRTCKRLEKVLIFGVDLVPETLLQLATDQILDLAITLSPEMDQDAICSLNPPSRCA